MPRYVVLEKSVGETPLACLEQWRSVHPHFAHIPLAYAGRLDPMASGKLLILIGDECKHQANYHALDKRYEFSVVCGVASDTADVLGRLSFNAAPPLIERSAVTEVTQRLVGSITLPYPLFSSKTVHGKPLHTWTLEGRTDEIDIPHKTSTIYTLNCTTVATITRHQLTDEACTKIATIPPVTDERKALGNDFRRVDVLADWQRFATTGHPTDEFPLLHFTCIASSGTYMRSLAEEIAKQLGTSGLTTRIHRTHIGRYVPLPFCGGIWLRQYRT